MEEVPREDRKVSREQEWRRRADFQLNKHVEGQLEVFPEVNRPSHEKKVGVGAEARHALPSHFPAKS